MATDLGVDCDDNEQTETETETPMLTPTTNPPTLLLASIPSSSAPPPLTVKQPSRIWSDYQEIEILKKYLDFIPHDTTSTCNRYSYSNFYEEMKKQPDFSFTKNQVLGKFKLFKKKYKHCVDQISSRGKDFFFKNHHEQLLFDISHKIWNSTLRVDDPEKNTLEHLGAKKPDEVATISISKERIYFDKPVINFAGEAINVNLKRNIIREFEFFLKKLEVEQDHAASILRELRGLDG